jgi:hypothetical protein
MHGDVAEHRVSCPVLIVQEPSVYTWVDYALGL